MSAYLIANVDVRDPEAYEAYRCRTREIIERHGGRFLVRGGAIEVLEGEPNVQRLVVIEFPNATAARAFYDSEDYQEIIPFRTRASHAALFIVEGFSES